MFNLRRTIFEICGLVVTQGHWKPDSEKFHDMYEFRQNPDVWQTCQRTHYADGMYTYINSVTLKSRLRVGHWKRQTPSKFREGVWYSVWLNCDDMLSRFHRIPERDGRTDRKKTDRIAISISHQCADGNINHPILMKFDTKEKIWKFREGVWYS